MRIDMQDRTCRHCGTGQATGRNAYCSNKCRRAAVNQRQNARRSQASLATCAACGVEFRQSHALAQLCSPACKRKRAAVKTAEWRTGRVPRWNVPRTGRLESCRDCGDSFYTMCVDKSGKQRCEECLRQAIARQKYASVALRRARMRTNGPVEAFDVAEIFERDGWQCRLCGGDIDSSRRWPAPDSPSLDHVVPLASGGGHTRNNVQAAHLFCNMSKGARASA